MTVHTRFVPWSQRKFISAGQWVEQDAWLGCPELLLPALQKCVPQQEGQPLETAVHLQQDISLGYNTVLLPSISSLILLNYWTPSITMPIAILDWYSCPKGKDRCVDWPHTHWQALQRAEKLAVHTVPLTSWLLPGVLFNMLSRWGYADNKHTVTM